MGPMDKSTRLVGSPPSSSCSIPGSQPNSVGKEARICSTDMSFPSRSEMTIIAFLCRDNLPAFNWPGSAPPPHPAQDVQPNIISISTLAMRLQYPDRSQLIHTPTDFSSCMQHRVEDSAHSCYRPALGPGFSHLSGRCGGHTSEITGPFLRPSVGRAGLVLDPKSYIFWTCGYLQQIGWGEEDREDGKDN